MREPLLITVFLLTRFVDNRLARVMVGLRMQRTKDHVVAALGSVMNDAKPQSHLAGCRTS